MSWDRLSDVALVTMIENMTDRCTAVLAMTEQEQQRRKVHGGYSVLDGAVITAHLLEQALLEWERRHPDEDGVD